MRRFPVLIADDQDVDRRIAEKALWWAGFDPILARDGAEAVAIARVRRPPVVVLDGLMPKMPGFETCRAIKAISTDYRPRVLILTAVYRAMRYVHESWRDFAVDGYLLKPIPPAELVGVVRRQFAWLESNDGAQLETDRKAAFEPARAIES